MINNAIKILAAAALCSTLAVCCAPSDPSETTVAALKTVNRGVDSAYNVLKQSYETFQSIEMDRALEGLTSHLDGVSRTLGSMKVDSDCQPLLDAITKKVDALRGIAATDAKEQVRIYKIPDTDFTDELRRQWDDISLRVDGKLSAVNDEVSKAIDDINQKFQKAGK